MTIRHTLAPFLILTVAACETAPEYALEFAPEAPLARIGAAHFRIGQPAFVLSPDGETVVYVGGAESDARLYRRTLTDAAATPIPGTEGAYGPFFSADGARIAFFANSRLKHVSVDGGDVVDLALVHNPSGGVWRADGTLLYADHECGRLYAIPERGGTPTTAITEAACLPHLLPGGQILAGHWEGLAVLDLATGERKELLADPNGFGSPRYLPTGHVLFTSAGRLLVAPFDAERLELTGEPTVVVDDLRTEALLLSAHYAVTPAGDLLYVPGTHGGVGQLVWVDDEGGEEPLPIPPASFGEYRLDPAGGKLAYALPGGGWSMHVHDLDAGSTRALTREGASYSPVWTRDGAAVLFRTRTATGYDDVRAPADGSAPPQTFRASTPFEFPQFMTHDGRMLVTALHSVENQGDVVAVRTEDPTGRSRTLVAGPAAEWGGVPSPDGRLLAYMTDEFGIYEVMVRAMAGGDAIRVSNGGAMDAIWSADGGTLFIQDVRRAYAVPIETRPTLRAGTPTLLFEGPYVDVGGHGWDRAPDGRFLLVRESEDASTPVTLRVLPRWLNTLAR